MADVIIDESNLYAIADSIRTKLGVQNTYKPSQMANAIDSISGGGSTLGTKTITANGTYDAEDDELDGYSEVTVNVGGITPTGTMNITANGTYDVTQYASADVAVPTGSTPVINSLSITENGTYTAPSGVDGYSPITVNVSGSTGYTIDDIFTQTQPSGDVVIGVASMPISYLAYRTAITKITAPNLNITANMNGVFQNCTNLKYAILPKYTRLYNSCFHTCSQLIGVDCLGGYIGSTVFFNCTKFNLLIIRKTDAIATISNVNSFGSCCFSANKAGGTLYVPADLISAYQANTNWGTVLGYNANNQIKSIESTATDPTAPIDLTRYYIDGTEIPT